MAFVRGDVLRLPDGREGQVIHIQDGAATLALRDGSVITRPVDELRGTGLWLALGAWGGEVDDVRADG